MTYTPIISENYYYPDNEKLGAVAGVQNMPKYLANSAASVTFTTTVDGMYFTFMPNMDISISYIELYAKNGNNYPIQIELGPLTTDGTTWLSLPSKGTTTYAPSSSTYQKVLFPLVGNFSLLKANSLYGVSIASGAGASGSQSIDFLGRFATLDDAAKAFGKTGEANIQNFVPYMFARGVA